MLEHSDERRRIVNKNLNYENEAESVWRSYEPSYSNEPVPCAHVRAVIPVEVEKLISTIVQNVM